MKILYDFFPARPIMVVMRESFGCGKDEWNTAKN